MMMAEDEEKEKAAEEASEIEFFHEMEQVEGFGFNKYIDDHKGISGKNVSKLIRRKR